MRIKSIEIVGFKSFNERTRINFPEGISAIVGPNGCGKSNIVDAVRWVMGEQSAKQLRGRHMEDILFNGTTRQQASGLAEVSMVLSNNGERQQDEPIGPSEITVTRRLYRSGDSEYLINKVPCRLKDISQFFMDTGMGTKAYSTIEQGRIGALVDSKPEDRRALIDEAAGITRYKAQKKESERKIESTEQNLVHIKTIINETKRQLNSINRASKKAAKYRELKIEIKALDLGLAAIRIDDLEARQKDVEAKKEELQALMVAQLTNLEKKELELNDLKLKLVENEKTADVKTELYHNLKNEFSSLLQDQGFIKNQLETNQLRQENLADELKGLEENIEARENELERIQANREEVKSRLDRQNSDQEHSQSQLEELTRSSRQFAAQKQALTAEAANLRSQIGRLEEMLSAFGRMSEGHARRRQETLSDLEKFDLEFEKLSGEAAELNQSIKAQTELRQKTQAELNQKRQEINVYRSEFEELNRQERELEASLAGLSSRLDALKEIKANFGWYPEAVQAIMASSELKGAGIIGPVAEHIDAPAGYEAAIEAALGERLHYLLVDDRNAVTLSLDFLKTEGLGRCGFISKSDMGQDNPELFIEALLGPYELVDNPQEALQHKSDKNVLSKDGLFISANGVIVGGQSTEEEQGLLSRLNEIDELSKQVEELVKTLTSANKRVEAKRQQMTEAEEDLEKGQVAFQEINQALVESEKRISALDAVGAETQSRQAGLKMTLEKTEEEAQALTEDKLSAESDIQKFDEQLLEVEVKTSAAAEDLDKLEFAIDEARRVHQEISNQTVALTGNLDTLLKDETRTNQWLEETRSGIRAKQQDLDRARQDKDLLQTKNESILENLNGFDSRLSTAEDAMQDERKSLDAIRSTLNARENELRKDRKQREQYNEGFNKLELDLQEVVYKRQNLFERLDTEYHIDLANMSKADFPDLPEGLSVGETESQRDEIKQKLDALGEVNLTAITEEEALTERYDFYMEQYDDLIESINNLRESIARINLTCKSKFMETFAAVDQKLREIFPILFEGGEAWLSLTDENNPLDTGVEIHVHPPGKKLTEMSLLSGGEKALVALAMLFALYLIKPSPFCLLDEIDAPLDEANIDRFNKLLHKLKQSSQIVLITHNKRTMQLAETLYGVTMEEPGVSKIVSVNLHEVEEKIQDGQMVQTV